MIERGKAMFEREGSIFGYENFYSEGMQKELNALGFNSLKDLIKSLSEK